MANPGYHSYPLFWMMVADVRHLRDPVFLTKALDYRTARLLFTLSLRLRTHTPRLGSFNAWNQCLNHILDLANAYIEGIVHKCFLRAVEACSDPECKKSLKMMR